MRKLITLFVLTIAICCSCQKELSNSNDNIVPNSDSGHLKMIIGLDTTQVAPNDTLYRFDVQYDNAGRVSQQSMTDYYSGVQEVFWTTKYVYSGSDNLPFQATDITTESAYTYHDTDYYQYNTPARALTYDSSVSLTITPTTQLSSYAFMYSYLPAGVLVTRNDYTNNIFQSSYSYIVHITKVNGNIIHQVDTIPYPYGSHTFDASYDDHPNPLTLIHPLDDPYLSDGGDYLLFAQPNNVTDMVADNSSSVAHLQITYTYNATGYPFNTVSFWPCRSTQPSGLWTAQKQTGRPSCRWPMRSMRSTRISRITSSASFEQVPGPRSGISFGLAASSTSPSTRPGGPSTITASPLSNGFIGSRRFNRSASV